MTGAHKITPSQALMIRKLHNEGMTYQELAEVYGVNDEHIRAIVKGLRHSVKNRTFIHKEEFEALDLLELWEAIVKIVSSKQ